jgi:ligand-binding SRPBCC domain-containing protein
LKIVVTTQVEQSLPHVWAGFDQRLFLKLNPPFPPVRLLRFDGCLTGDVVHIQLNFLFFRQDWISKIIDQQESQNEIFFIDQGDKLPFFLSFWHHKHRLVRQGDHTLIVDEVTYKTPGGWLMDWLFYPILWGQFVYRKPIYKRYFGGQ